MCIYMYIYIVPVRIRSWAMRRESALPVALAGGGDARDAGLAFARYCHHQYCMVYGINRGGRWRGVYCAMGGQLCCNRVGFASGGGNIRMMDSHN